MTDGVPQAHIHLPEELLRVRIPGPPQIVGQLTQTTDPPWQAEMIRDIAINRRNHVNNFLLLNKTAAAPGAKGCHLVGKVRVRRCLFETRFFDARHIKVSRKKFHLHPKNVNRNWIT
jgi:hypothetical protein